MTSPDSPIDPNPPSAAPAANRRWADEPILVIVLIVVAIGFHFARGPVRSTAYPGIMSGATAVQYSDPPSMDEVWSLVLSTGRGSPYDLYPRDVLLPKVPAWTSLADAPPVWKVWTTLSDVTHPPLYFTTLRLWRNVFGGTDLAAIAYSVMWSSVTLVFVYLAARLALGRAGAFWSAAALAVSPLASYFALEIRSYSMLTAESAILLWLMVRMTLHGPRPRDVAGFSVVLLAMMLTHYLAAPACVAAGLYMLVVAGRRWPRILAGGLAAAGAYAVVWLPFAVKQLHLMSDSSVDYLRADTPQAWLSTLAALAVPFRLLAETVAWPPLEVRAIICAPILLGVIVVAVRRPAVRPFVVLFLVATGYLLATDIAKQMVQLYLIRYNAAVQPAAAVFVPAVLVGLVPWRWVVHVGGGLWCALLLVAQPIAIHNDAPTFTPAAAAIAPRMDKNDVLLLYARITPGQKEFTTDGIVQEFSHVPGCFPRDVAILNRPMTPELARQLAGRRAWLLTFGGPVDVGQIVPGARVLAQAEFYTTTASAGRSPAYRLALPSAPAATAP